MRWVTAVLITVFFSAAGCGGGMPECALAAAGPIHLVLTFDDGPFAADIADKDSATPDALLAPLRSILEALQRRAASGVFYVTGPGMEELASKLAVTFADALEEKHRGGHVLGYHAFAHQQVIWADPLIPFPLIEPLMDADLDRLQRFISESLGPRGESIGDVFSPIFRQPYGGLGLLVPAGDDLAARRGWTYHGFRVDSGDWLANADVDPALREKLGVDTPQLHEAFVVSRLRAGAAANAGCASFDVLFHVNGFTAARIDTWMDELSNALGGPTGVVFDVPSSYLSQSDAFIDAAVAEDLLGG